MKRRALRHLVTLLALALASSGCLSFDEPSPSPVQTPQPTPIPEPTPRDPTTLVVIAPAIPLSLLPPAANETEALLHDLLYDTLYRLDEALRPRPGLAVDLPRLSSDGLTWNLEIRADGRFHDGREVSADDVLFSLRLATSPACPFGRDLCSAAADHLVSAGSPKARRIEITLDQPWSPLLAEVLARLPILSQRAVRNSSAAIIEAADRLGADAPDALVTRIADATTADECFAEPVPPTCRLSHYREDLERLHRRGGLTLPPVEAFTDPTGRFDEEAYAGALLDRAATLAGVLNTSAADQHAAALRLLDAQATPLGGGPFRLEPFETPDHLVLLAHSEHAGGGPGIGRIEIRVVEDPSMATTAMRSGDADWILRVGQEEEAGLRGTAGIRVGRRPVPVQRAILFNVREGRLYSDVRLRKAFVLCLDREAITRDIGADRPLALTPGAAGSWAMPRLPQPARDAAAARALLEEAGWLPGPDGIRARAGRRLSSAIAVRASRPDLASFAHAAAEQLRECGIELRVEEMDTVSDAILRQLQWPNDFETLLMTRSLGLDPDRDVTVFESSRVTGPDHLADANAGGYASEAADAAIATGRAAWSEQERRSAYLALQTRLYLDAPFWPIWYDTASSAIAERVSGPHGTLDPDRPRFDWDVAGWTLATR